MKYITVLHKIILNNCWYHRKKSRKITIFTQSCLWPTSQSCHIVLKPHAHSPRSTPTNSPRTILQTYSSMSAGCCIMWESSNSTDQKLLLMDSVPSKSWAVFSHKTNTSKTLWCNKKRFPGFATMFFSSHLVQSCIQVSSRCSRTTHHHTTRVGTGAGWTDSSSRQAD